MCDHVLALYYEKKIMKPFSEQPKVGRYRRNSNAHWITMIPSKQPNSKMKISSPATLVRVPANFKYWSYLVSASLPVIVERFY